MTFGEGVKPPKPTHTYPPMIFLYSPGEDFRKIVNLRLKFLTKDEVHFFFFFFFLHVFRLDLSTTSWHHKTNIVQQM